MATNAGGPHAFKYGNTGAWVTGIEAVVSPGRVVRVGGAQRKDVGGYDIKSLLVGSEGTLGIITAVTLRLLPAPEALLPVVAFFRDAESGCAAVVERFVLPPGADEDIPEDPDEAATYAAQHPDRQELRMVAGVTRAGATYCAMRFRSHDDDTKVVGDADLVPALLELLAATLTDEPGDINEEKHL